MKIVQVQSREIKGICIRTKNSDEISSTTAKIGNLWRQFFSRISTLPDRRARIYGVYHNYESDYSGEFSVLAGADLFSQPTERQLDSVSIAAGKYLVFSTTISQPNSVGCLWESIAHYFSSTKHGYQRAYTTDFELHKSPTKIDVYISIK